MVLFYTAIVTLGTILFTLLLTAPHSTAAAVIQAQQDQTVTQKEKCDNSATTRGCCEIMQTRYQSLPFYLDGQDSNFVCRVESSGNEYPGLVKKAWTGLPTFRTPENILFALNSGGSRHESWVPRILNESLLRGHNVTFTVRNSQHVEAAPMEIERIVVGLLGLVKANALKDPCRGIHPHIRLLDWAPQFSILKHPSMTTFLSSSGGTCLFEAPYAGKRTAIKPFFGDQLTHTLNSNDSILEVHIYARTAVERGADLVEVLFTNMCFVVFALGLGWMVCHCIHRIKNYLQQSRKQRKSAQNA
ncbi:hypothetical protein BDA99DRAFT_558370 [Phascolomyces articulosus]|uniref:Uncharacterized protein n=1 Tax=Phascolomyces articulosus TaxID=60185 RepID=A0AAD5KE93_9FUNG|nr:hypothetical protein BDA99DRAFT_558370 [Phascolomyces articulosus]